MNVKNNKRRRESVRRIRQAFFELLKTQDFLKIKVSDICKLADINRTTFYAEYDDIFDLAETICNQLRQEVNDLFENEQEVILNEDSFLRLLGHISAHQERYIIYFRLGYDMRGWDLCLQPYVLEEEGDEFLAYRLAFFKHGFNAIVKLWLENGCKETPQQMCRILLHEYRGRGLVRSKD